MVQLTREGLRYRRIDRLMQSAIQAMKLDFRDIGVLTEAASDHFASTCLMAAMAGARPVVAVAKDSKWGTADEVVDAVRSHAEYLGIGDHLRFVSEISRSDAEDCSLVTNLGFVRPLTDRVLSTLPANAAVSLMCEPWEARSSDVDTASAARRLIAVAGTNETHPLVRTFEYLGPLAGRLMLEVGVEIIGATAVVVASEPFAQPIRRWLLSAGASRVNLEPPPLSPVALSKHSENLDVLIIAHMGHKTIDAESGSTSIPSLLADSDAALLVIAGDVDVTSFQEEGVVVNPPDAMQPGRMWVTTSLVGPKPVVNLHCAGLKVGELLIRSRRSGLSIADAVLQVVDSGYGLSAKDVQSHI